MPIHIRANPGDYADACLLPGDPLRAKYIADTFLSDVVQRNGERGMLGYTGTFEGKPVSVQSSGMGCPSAAIVIEELVQLGVKKIMRVGPIVSSDIFYQPDPTLAERWSDRGILAVEMEAAVLFTLGALRKFQAGCMLIVSDVIVEGEFLRISDEDMRKAVDEMTELALHTVTA